MTLIFGIGALLLFLIAARFYSTANPQQVANALRIGGGIALLALAALLTATGRFYVAAPLAYLGAMLLGWIPSPAGFGARMRKTPGQVSRVRARFIEMELDHDSGTMRGRVLEGQFANVPLDALDRPTLVGLLAVFDAESRALLEAYLDRREAGWREDVDENAGAGSGQAPGVGPMTQEEALQILGLEPGAGAFEIRRAHWALMKKLHPDQGGSTYLAARVNEAARLLEQHGLGAAAERQIRQLSKGMAQTVQLLGTLVHEPRLVILDEPFSGLDALNQGKLERMIRALADRGTTVIFSTHVIAHAERLCEGVAIIANGKVSFAGKVDEARDRIPPQVRLETRAVEGAWRATLPDDARREGNLWYFDLPPSGVEPLLRALIEGEAGIVSLSIERAGLHDAFVAIAGEAVAAEMGEEIEGMHFR